MCFKEHELSAVCKIEINYTDLLYGFVKVYGFFFFCLCSILIKYTADMYSVKILKSRVTKP